MKCRHRGFSATSYLGRNYIKLLDYTRFLQGKQQFQTDHLSEAELKTVWFREASGAISTKGFQIIRRSGTGLKI